MEIKTQEQLMAEINRLKDSLARKDREIEKMKVNSFFLETLFDGIDEQIMVIDSKFFIQDVNRVFLEQYGLKKEDVLEKNAMKSHTSRTAPVLLEGGYVPWKRLRKQVKGLR